MAIHGPLVQAFFSLSVSVAGSLLQSILELTVLLLSFLGALWKALITEEVYWLWHDELWTGLYPLLLFALMWGVHWL